MAKKKLVSFRFKEDFIKKSKIKAVSRKETLTDYIVYCVEKVNDKVK
jgi:hypothetical protein